VLVDRQDVAADKLNDPAKRSETVVGKSRKGFTARKAVRVQLSGRKEGQPMLGFIFGFNARLGRLHYFLSTIAVAVVMTAVVFAVFVGVGLHAPRGAHLSLDSIRWPVIILSIVFGWVTLTLQSMRVRDIGWDPVCVIPGWMALLIIDKLLATKIPAWSLGHDHHGTVVGSLINLALLVALTFWPSGDYDDSMPSFDKSPPKPDRPMRTGNVAPRIARATNAEFGRRTV
jgi:uncharacterized membrane protein YhaH (DUF805 family)